MFDVVAGHGAHEVVLRAGLELVSEGNGALRRGRSAYLRGLASEVVRTTVAVDAYASVRMSDTK